MRAAGAPRRAGRWSSEPSSSFSPPFLFSHALSPLTLHFCLSAPAGPLSAAPFSERDASGKGRAVPRCSFSHLCGAAGLPAPPPDPHRARLGGPGPCSCPPCRTLKVPGRPGTLLGRPHAVLCLRQLGTGRLRARPDPPLLTINLAFTGRLRAPPPPSRSPSPSLPSGWSRALSTSPSPLSIAAEGPLFLRPVPLIAITSLFLDSAASFLPAFFFLPSLKHYFPVPFCQHD